MTREETITAIHTATRKYLAANWPEYEAVFEADGVLGAPPLDYDGRDDLEACWVRPTGRWPWETDPSAECGVMAIYTTTDRLDVIELETAGAIEGLMQHAYGT